MTQTRKDMAVTCQGGASNRRRVSRALHEAIEECYLDGVNADDDPSVFLIAHQLIYLLTGHDFVVGEERLQRRYDAAMKDVMAPTKTKR